MPANGHLCTNALKSIYVCMAGEEGFEPSNGGIKIRCLNQLGDSPALTFAYCGTALSTALLSPVYQTASGCSLNPRTAQHRHPDGHSASAAAASFSVAVGMNTADPDPVIRAGPWR